MECFNSMYFTYPSRKLPMKNILKGKDPSKRHWRGIGRTFCLSRSKLVNEISSPSVEDGCFTYPLYVFSHIQWENRQHFERGALLPSLFTSSQILLTFYTTPPLLPPPPPPLQEKLLGQVIFWPPETDLSLELFKMDPPESRPKISPPPRLLWLSIKHLYHIRVLNPPASNCEAIVQTLNDTHTHAC